MSKLKQIFDEVTKHAIEDSEGIRDDGLARLLKFLSVQYDELDASYMLIEGWVSVDDRLPEDSRIVLTASQYGIECDYLHKDRWDRRDITHWMNLPLPPIKDE